MNLKSFKTDWLTLCFIQFRKLSVCFLVFSANVVFAETEINFHSKMILPDTVPEGNLPDTTGLVQETNFDGIDTIWYLGIEDSDVASESMKVGLVDSSITINLGNEKRSVIKSLFGFGTAGIFTKNQMPNDTFALDQWQWTSDLQPQVLRFPGGAESKFMDVLKGPGYGWDISIISRYYDMTDSIRDLPPYSDILDDEDIQDSLIQWMSSSYIDEYGKFWDKWKQQSQVDSTHRYIDDFITMVKKIETENGTTVNVVYCLNIFSNTATQCVDIIKYLRDSTINHIYPVTVIGVEMGNEPYFDYARLIMGWNSFGDYWDYINGINSVDTVYKEVLGDSLWNDHDFIGAFKNHLFFHCSVGIPAENLHDGDYALFASNGPEEESYRSIDEDWNSKLREKYNVKEFIVEAMPTKRYAFDAVIIHPYYDTHNWKDIPLSNLYTSYECNLDDSISGNDEWIFDNFDDRLEGTFDTIRINFRKFIKVRYKESYDVHRDTLLFYPGASHPKDLWVTEWNFKDQDPSLLPAQLNQAGVFSHGFMHGYVTFEWFLKDLKLNYDAGYRTNFRTISTFHNLAGGGTNAMIHPATNQELDTLGKLVFPYNQPEDSSFSRNYLIKMTTWFTFELLSEITKNDLKLLQTNYTIGSKSINVQPTVFIDPDQNFLYIYFSNTRDTTQQYTISTLGTFGVYEDGGKIQIVDTAEIFCIDALKPYSTSGKGNGTLYKLNETYAISADTTCNEPYPWEIRKIDTLINNPWGDSLLTLTAPAYSYGYYKIPIRAYYPLRADEVSNYYGMKIYPNPAYKSIAIVGLENESPIQGKLTVRIINMSGSLCIEAEITSGQQLNISSLSYGLYQIYIKFEDGNTIVSKLIKQ